MTPPLNVVQILLQIRVEKKWNVRKQRRVVVESYVRGWPHRSIGRLTWACADSGMLQTEADIDEDEGIHLPSASVSVAGRMTFPHI